MTKRRILVVGQTPPPFLGQAIMIKNTIDNDYQNIEIKHVRMNFSSGPDEMGKVNLRKLWILIVVIFKVFYFRLRYNVKNLYYPPAGPDTAPIIRDIIILGAVRWSFSRTILHFRAGGISEKVDLFPKLLKYITKIVFNKPDLTIRLSERNPEDGQYFNTKNDTIIPNGLKDHCSRTFERNESDIPILLFVGAVKETKGVLDLLRACEILKKEGVVFKLHIVGPVESDFFNNKMDSLVKKSNMENDIFFLGKMKGEEKWDEFRKAAIFCFPSYFECETFGNVLVEAMQFSLPVISTNWRGIPDIVEDGSSGYLVDIKDPIGLAHKIHTLIANPSLRTKFGARGRILYEEKFREEEYYKNFEKQILKVAI